MYNEAWNKYIEEKSEEPENIRLTKEEINDMMHIAVNVNDKKWFYELAERLKGME